MDKKVLIAGCGLSGIQAANLLLSQGTRIFERGGIDHEQERLEKENRKLKETIGELHMELKKNDW